MKFKILLVLFSFCLSFANSQELQKFDSILKIENSLLNSKEIRIYKDFSTSTGLELFRIFEDEHGRWTSEFYETIAQKAENNQINIRVRKRELNSLKNFEVIWLNLYFSDIMSLPDFEQITYKLRPKDRKIFIEDGELVIQTTNRSFILDGVSYYVQIKNGDITKMIEYPNPESYLQKYPDIDELIIFNDFLNIIKEEFTVFKN